MWDVIPLARAGSRSVQNSRNKVGFWATCGTLISVM